MSIASTAERLMLDLVNAERAEAGVPLLKLEKNLNQSSEAHTKWMFDNGILSHDGQGGSSAYDRMQDAGFNFSGFWSWGENIIWTGLDDDGEIEDEVRAMHESLMQDSGHLENILNPDFQLLGVGIEEGMFLGNSAVVMTQNFGRTSAPVSIDVKPKVEPEPEPEPEAPNTRPEVKLGRIKVHEGETKSIGDLVNYSDADGDSAVRYRIRDKSGDDSFMVKGKVVDASPNHTFRAKHLDTLKIIGDEAGDRQTVKIKVFDGEDWSKWDKFIIRTTRASRDKTDADLDHSIPEAPAPEAVDLALDLDLSDSLTVPLVDAFEFI